METTRQNKVARLLLKDLSDILQKMNATLAPGQLITVTVVRISPDLSVARVYVSIFPAAQREQTLEAIRQNAKNIRMILGNRVRHQLRIIPELVFFLDDSLDYAERIDDLLKH
jgi:ribosome-binding factor A